MAKTMDVDDGVMTSPSAVESTNASEESQAVDTLSSTNVVGDSSEVSSPDVPSSYAASEGDVTCNNVANWLERFWCACTDVDYSKYILTVDAGGGKFVSISLTIPAILAGFFSGKLATKILRRIFS